VLGLQQLKLQRHDQPVLRASRPQADQAFAAFEHCAAGQRLQTVEVSLTGGVGFRRPVAPQRLHFGLERLVGRQALRLDAGADRVGHEGFDACLRPGIAAHEVTALAAQFVAGRQHRGDRAGVAGHPRQRATTTPRCLVDGRLTEEATEFA